MGHKGWVDNLYNSSEADSPMLTTASQTPAELATALLTHYSFDLSGYNASELVNRWYTQYPVSWLHLAVIEALYQGRYKAISVQQILTFWQRRGQATYHFNMEFERLICSKFPQSLTELEPPILPTIKPKIPEEPATIEQPVTPNSLPAEVGNNYGENQLATPQAINPEQEGKEVESILGSSTLKTTASGIQLRLDPQNCLQRDSPLPKSHHKTKVLPFSANHPPIGQFSPAISHESDSFTSKLKAMSDGKE
jgi:hypothetical protein